MLATEVAWFPIDLAVACAMLSFIFCCVLAMLALWVVNGFKVADDRYFAKLEEEDDSDDELDLVEWDHCGRTIEDEDYDD